MKRFTAFTLVLMLIFAFVVSAAAEDLPSPAGKEYYKISTFSEGSGTASTSTNKVDKNTDGTATLTATPDKGYFTTWVIKGDYEILNGGKLTDPQITIKPNSDIEATAIFRVDEEDYTMTAKVVTPGRDTATVTPSKVAKDSEKEVIFTANAVDSEFVEWTFSGEYKIISGDLKSKTVVLIPYTDVIGTAYFKNGAKPDNPDEGDTAPKTGDPIHYVIPLMLIAAFAAFMASMKLRKN